jgi:hypothetical protein
MAVVSCDEMGNKREASLDSKGQRRYMRIFVVITDDPCTSAGDVGNAAGLPLMFDPLRVPNNLASTTFFVDDGARVSEIRPREDNENPFRWEVEVHYDSNCPDADQGTPDPLNRAAVYTWSNEIAEEALVWDEDGNPILNSAAMPFNPPPTRPVSYDVLTVERYEQDYPANAADYAFATNIDAFYGYEPGQARMDPITATPVMENAEDVFKVKYVIRFRSPNSVPGDDPAGNPRLPWNYQPLDHGPCAIKNGTWVNCNDSRGRQLSDVLLDGHGNQLANPGPSNAVYMNFRIYKQAIFASLNL